MKQAVSNIRHLFRVYLAVFKLSVMSRFANPGSAMLGFVNVFSDMFIYIIFAGVIFSYVPSIVGFSRDQLFIIVGTTMLVEWLSWFTFRSGTSNAPYRIRNGYIESAFVRPMPSQFLALFTRMDIEDSTRALTGLILIIPHAAAIAAPGALHILLYIIALLAGLIVYFGLLSSIAALGFLFGKIDGLYALVAEINDAAKYPHTIFGKKIRWIFFSLLPTAFIGSVPAIILTTSDPWGWLGVSVGSALLFLYTSALIWRWAEKHYSGASG